ncbi:hypothetical protein B4U80_14605 [Leptotrombidium deliense]|uniref:F-box domain-containing protein n=1 Tax=Leptotrombidium deliense TaxID=299467 RepID=A0A443RT95_9ACAR|nr:hypothetical protein B4U80_14605 [Leptotrombidium deliense]
MSMDSLPNELLSIIFSFLSIRERIGLQRVCKRWSEVIELFGWYDVANISFIFSEAETSGELFETIKLSEKNCKNLRSVYFYLLSHKMFYKRNTTHLTAIGETLASFHWEKAKAIESESIACCYSKDAQS